MVKVIIDLSDHIKENPYSVISVTVINWYMISTDYTKLTMTLSLITLSSPTV
jgi:hypothetical protein